MLLAEDFSALTPQGASAVCHAQDHVYDFTDELLGQRVMHQARVRHPLVHVQNN